MRKFLEVDKEFRKVLEVETLLPKRSTSQSAGYDFFSKETAIIEPGGTHMFWTDIRTIMEPDEVLFMFTRSGNGCKRGITLRNNVGVIDADYATNPANQIGIMLFNEGTERFEVKVGDRIAQGIFVKYLATDDDDVQTVRDGGFGSSGK